MLDVETDAYIHCVSAFVKLAQSEYQLLTEVIPEHHQKKTFDSLIQVLPRPGPCPAPPLGPAQVPQQELSLQKLEFGPGLWSVAVRYRHHPHLASWVVQPSWHLPPPYRKHAACPHARPGARWGTSSQPAAPTLSCVLVPLRMH